MTPASSALLGVGFIVAGLALTALTHGQTVFYGLVVVGIWRLGNGLLRS